MLNKKAVGIREEHRIFYRSDTSRQTSTMAHAHIISKLLDEELGNFLPSGH